ESYRMDQEGFNYVGFDKEEEVDIYVLEWNKLLQFMHDLKALCVNTLQEDFSIDELRALLEADEIDKLKQYLYKVVENNFFNSKNYVVEHIVAEDNKHIDE